jgi:S-DNA-T family DNA segregation ATPase FtsK/SpoIIIE
MGLGLAKLSVNYMGYIASLLIHIALIVISILLIFETSLVAMFGPESYFAKMMYPFNFLVAKIFGFKKDEDEDEDEDDDEDKDEDEEEDDDEEEENEDEEEDDDEEDEEENEDEDDEDDSDDEDNEEEIKSPVPFMKKEINEPEEFWWKPTGLEINIPLSLLNSKKGKPTSGDIEHNSEIIHHSLENFGIPVDMGSVSVGPTVTQYTFKPSEGIKLSKITNLSNDLALALAAHPIRIEAPIPGKSLVGVEVPNQAKAIVNLRETLSSKVYKERKNNMFLALGKDVAGRAWMDDLTKMPHLLVAGATNSGKSVCLNAIIISLMYQNSPDDLRFIMVDPKRVEMTTYNNIPYLLCPVIDDVPKTVNALKWCLNEMDRRYEILKNSGKKNIQAFNEGAEERMPYIVFVIDELADLMVANAKDIEGAVIRLAQMARAVGIHLILATQRPSVDVITGLIKANMPARIAFSVASGTDSRTILDMLGAEKLLGRGDMLFKNAEMSKPVRLQGAFLSDDEIEKIVKYVKKKAGKPKYINEIIERQVVKGMGGIGLDGMRGDEDELLSEAKEIVVNMGRASASFLQRKLRIGYARAASILDQLEELGIIGPSNGSKPREILISKEQMSAIDSMGSSGMPIHDRNESEAPENYLGEESGSATIFKNDDEEDDEEKKDDEDDDEEDDEEENNNEDDEEKKDDEEDDDDGEGEDDDDEEDDDEGKYFSK